MEQIKTVENILKFESELGFDLPKTYLMLLTAIGEQEQIELEGGCHFYIWLYNVNGTELNL